MRVCCNYIAFGTPGETWVLLREVILYCVSLAYATGKVIFSRDIEAKNYP